MTEGRRDGGREGGGRGGRREGGREGLREGRRDGGRKGVPDLQSSSGNELRDLDRVGQSRDDVRILLPVELSLLRKQKRGFKKKEVLAWRKLRRER